MAGVEFLSFQGLWLVVAGFILGFAASTLWEWLYYRGKRQAQLEQTPSAPAYTPRSDSQSSRSDDPASAETADAWAFAYRSPGVYLESEQPSTTNTTEPAPDNPQAKIIIEPPVSQATLAPRMEPATPRINPATLAALQTTVAQTPVAQPTAPAVTAPDVAVTGEMQRPSALAVTLPPAKMERRNGFEPIAHSGSNGVEQPPPQSMPAAVAPPTVQPISKPQPITAATTEAIADHPDNLAMIRGVGEAYKRRLYGVGIYTWRQVAESDIETLRRITRAKPNADINAWRVQARELAEKYQRWQTTFRGPLDDFTRIDGIGAITADLLYKAGICTYEQLAGALPDELAKIVPAPTVGDENDFEGWIASAVRFANVKRRNEGLLA